MEPFLVNEFPTDVKTGIELTMAVDLERQTHNHTKGNNFDGLDKAFVIFRLPATLAQPHRFHRRVDLIVSSNQRYSLAVLGWSGSMIFERDLRSVKWIELKQRPLC
jgi:hypothetical protein